MLGLVLTFVHWGYVFFHCINIEHIPECLVWWHSVPYLGYYFTLGYNPILRFIRCFADFSHYSFYFLIFVGLHTGAYPHLWVYQAFCVLFSLLILFLDLCGSSHWGIPHPWVYQAFCVLFHCSFYFLIFVGLHTGAYPHPWVYQAFCVLFHYSIYFLIFVGPTLRHTPIFQFIRCFLDFSHYLI